LNFLKNNKKRNTPFFKPVKKKGTPLFPKLVFLGFGKRGVRVLNKIGKDWCFVFFDSDKTQKSFLNQNEKRNPVFH